MADAQLVLPPGFRVTDANDQPISGAKLKFYSAGTSTPATVYSDSGLLTSLGSTITCDDGGYPTSDGSTKTLIYTGTSDYKLVITDSNDVVLVTHDNIKGAPAIPAAADATYPKTPVLSRTTTTTITSDYETYRGRLINANPTGGSFAITLPSAVMVGDGYRIGIRHKGTANTVAIKSVGGQVIGGAGQSSMTSFALTGLGHTVWLVSDGAGWTIDTEAPPLLSHGLPWFKAADRVATPPDTPTAGARYIITGTPLGSWATLGFAEHDIAEADGNGSWIGYTPTDGWMAYVEDENVVTQFRDTTWVDNDGWLPASASALKHAIFEYRVNNGVTGGSATIGAWTTRALNTTIVNTITGASLATNNITLPVGKYLVVTQQKFSATGTEGSSSGKLRAQTRLNAGTAVITSTDLYGISGEVGSQASGSGLTFSVETTYAPTDTFVLDVTTGGTLNLQYLTNAGSLGVASDDSTGQEVYARVTVIDLASLQGPPGSQGIQGATGPSGGLDFAWNTATSGDPGSGNVLANNATLSSATAIHISKTGRNGESLGAVIGAWDDSTNTSHYGHLRIFTVADRTEFIEAKVTSLTDNTTYYTVGITVESAAGTPSLADVMSVFFERTGNAGVGGTVKYVSVPMEMYRNAGSSVTGGSSSVAFANPGSAFTASTHQWYASTFDLSTLVYARWLVAWTPGHASNACAIRLCHSDSGPTNTTEIERFTQTGTTPRVDAVDVTTDIQALVANKTLHYQTLGNGTEAPAIYLSTLELVFEVKV